MNMKNEKLEGILYADYDVENDNVMFVITPTGNRFEWDGADETHEPEIITDAGGKLYMVMFNI